MSEALPEAAPATDPARAVIEAANAKAAAFAERWRQEYPALAAGLRGLLMAEQDAWAATKAALSITSAHPEATLPAVVTPGALVTGDRDWNLQMANIVQLPNVTGDLGTVAGKAPYWAPLHSFTHHH